MRRPAVLCFLTACLWIVSGCARAPKPQLGGGNVTTLGGPGPTSLSTTAPENSQTPTTTTLEKTTERTYELPGASAGNEIPHETGGAATGAATSSDREGFPRREQSETARSREAGSRVAPVAAHPSPRVLREVITEKATTQIGTSQDQAGILKAWGAATAAHYKSLLWAVVLGVAAWRAWKREWPLVAALLGVGAVLSLLVEWWVGPVSAGTAVLVWSAYHVALAQGIKLRR